MDRETHFFPRGDSKETVCCILKSFPKQPGYFQSKLAQNILEYCSSFFQIREQHFSLIFEGDINMKLQDSFYQVGYFKLDLAKISLSNGKRDSNCSNEDLCPHYQILNRILMAALHASFSEARCL